MSESLTPPPVFPTPPQPVMPPPAMGAVTSGFAIASLILGIFSLFCMGLLTGIPAIFCGAVAMKKISKSRGQIKGEGLAIAGLVMGAIGLVIGLLLPAIMLPALARAREAARRSSCQNNLKQMGLVYKMYANETKGGLFPDLSPEAGCLMSSGEEIYPWYLTDPSVLICPSSMGGEDAKARMQTDPMNSIDDNSYVYLGYVITSDDEMEAFAEVYKARVAQGLPFNEDLKAPPGRGTSGSGTFYRLQEGVERFLVKDISNPAEAAMVQSSIPILWDKAVGKPGGAEFNHVPGGCNVLYMDGHVAFLRYPGDWPMTPRTLAVIAELDALRK